MKTLNIIGSTGIIGTKALVIVNKYFPKIKINLLVANKNYKKLAKQANIYKPKYVCIIDKSKYKKLHNELKNNKVKILIDSDLSDYLKRNKSDISILSIAGYGSLKFIKSIIINTKILGIVNKECIVAGGHFINQLCNSYKTKLYALDSEHFSIQNYFAKNSYFNKNNIQQFYLTASGGPFFKKPYKYINNAHSKML